MTTALNTNQFAQVPIRGLVDWSISRSGIITGQVSANESGTVEAGDSVILDPAATGLVPQFILAANSDPKAFYVPHNAKGDSYVAGDQIEVGGNFGPVIWLTAEATIAMGATVEDVVASNTVQTLAGNKARGIALLNGTTGNLLPIMLITPCVTAS